MLLKQVLQVNRKQLLDVILLSMKIKVLVNHRLKISEGHVSAKIAIAEIRAVSGGRADFVPTNPHRSFAQQRVGG